MADNRPNIILIITDQQRCDTIDALGYPHMATPNLDRLVREGVSFENAFVTAASCAPSRASLFTGYYPHTTGIFKNKDVWRHSWVEQLADAGYHCVNIGKMHTYPFETPLGFHERFVVENKDRYLEGRYFFDRWDMALQARGLIKQQRELYRRHRDYRERCGAFEWELPEDTHSDFFVGDLASWWIGSKPPQQPLFLEIGFPGPHPPYDPPRDVFERYRDRELPPVPVGDWAGEFDRPLSGVAARRGRLPEPVLARTRRAYYAQIDHLDYQIGRIFQRLTVKNWLASTLVIFVSDHGELLGDHCMFAKFTPHEGSAKVPLIVEQGEGDPQAR